MLTLHTHPFSRGRVARWMLEETGAPYEAVVVPFGPGMRTPDYLALNPMAKVPTLVHPGGVVTEVAAIVAWLAETFPAAGLLPADKGSFLRWMFLGAGPLEYAITNASMGFHVPAESEGRMGYGSLDRVLGALAAQLDRTPNLCGDAWSAADLYLGSQVAFAAERGGLPVPPRLMAWATEGRDRPAAKRAQEKDDALAASLPRG